MANIEEVKNGYFKCEWGQLHYRSVNLDSKKPLLVMLHLSLIHI